MEHATGRTALLLVLAAVTAAAAEHGRVATIHSSWNKGAYAFRGEWAQVLKPLGVTVDDYENTQIGALASKLDEYDVVVACSVFNYEHTQDLLPVGEPFLGFLRRGGILLVTDASYASTLAGGVCKWSVDFALGSERASAHTRPSEETRRLRYGPAPGLAQVPNDLLPLASEAGHWAHMVPQSETWREAIHDSDGCPTLAWQPVGRGLLVLTSYYSLHRGKKQELGRALWENALFLRQSLHSGLEVRSLDWGGVNPGQNNGQVRLRLLAPGRGTPTGAFVLWRENDEAHREALHFTAEDGEGVAGWVYRVEKRGPHRLELRLESGDDARTVVLTHRRTVPELMTLFAWKRHFVVGDQSAAVEAELVPEQPFDTGAYRLKARALMTDTAGPEIELGAALRATLDVPLTGLPAGKGCVRVALVRGERELATQELPITLTAEPYVRIMPDRSCRVGGKPFFPLGMYIVSWQLPDTEAILTRIRAIAAGGFNLVHVGVRNDAEFAAVLEEARSLGIMVIPEGGAALKAVETVRDHPAILAWNPGDEPDGGGRPARHMAEIVGRIKDRDATRPTYMTLCVPATYGRYFRAADILAPDPYPIPRRDIAFVAECVERLQDVVERRKPLWAIPQAFGGYGSWSRPPTPAEARNMTYQCLIHGARGLVCYTFWDHRFAMVEHPELWGMMQRLAREVTHLSPLLLADTEEHVLRLGPNRQVHALVKSDGDDTYLLLVNTARGDLGSVEIPLPRELSGTWQGLFGEPSRTARDGVLSVAAPPLAAGVYRRDG